GVRSLLLQHRLPRWLHRVRLVRLRGLRISALRPATRLAAAAIWLSWASVAAAKDLSLSVRVEGIDGEGFGSVRSADPAAGSVLKFRTLGGETLRVQSKLPPPWILTFESPGWLAEEKTVDPRGMTSAFLRVRAQGWIRGSIEGALRSGADAELRA